MHAWWTFRVRGFGFTSPWQAHREPCVQRRVKPHGCGLRSVGARMPRQTDPWMGVRITVPRRGALVGACSFGDFSCTSKKSYSPVSGFVYLRSKVVATGEKALCSPIKALWSCFARFYVGTLHNLALIRASNFLCLHKESHQRNAPRRSRPTGKPWPDLQKQGRPDATSLSRRG